MADASLVVDVQISATSVVVTQKGFGVPLVLAPNGAWAGRVKIVTGPDDLADLNLATGDATLRALNRMLQNPNPPAQIMVGRCANKPVQIHKITVGTVANLTKYILSIEDQAGAHVGDVSYTSDANATNDEIITGLAAAVAALAPSGVTVDGTVGGVGTLYLTITANAGGTFTKVKPDNIDFLTVEQTHADPGAAADLDAIKLENDGFYCVLNPGFNSKLHAAAISGWCETAKKLFLCASQDTPIATVASVGDTTSIAATTKALGRAYTAVIFHESNAAFADAAWGSLCLPMTPGSETWKFSNLAGVEASKLTSTHRTNILAKNANLYITVAGLDVTIEGTTAKGTGLYYIDTVRGLDWTKARMSENGFAALAGPAPRKNPFTNRGIANMEAAVRATLSEGVENGLFTADPPPAVSVPDAKTVPTADKQGRVLRRINWSATLAGAIHGAKVTGSVSF